jgi:hypothetical protein
VPGRKENLITHIAILRSRRGWTMKAIHEKNTGLWRKKVNELEDVAKVERRLTKFWAAAVANAVPPKPKS